MENDILDSLEDLGYNGPLKKEGALLESIQGEHVKPEFMSLCKLLTDDIQVFAGDIENIAGVDKDEFSIEISGFLREYGCPYSELLGATGLSSPHNRLLLLGFLTSELQACRILGQREEEMDVDQQEASPAFQHVSAMLTALGVAQPPEQSSVFDVLSVLEKKVTEVLRKCPKGYLGEPLLTKRLNTVQWAQVNKINDSLSREYSLRRKTLLTRLDVTIRSFHWSELGKKKQDSISGDLRPIRESLEIQAPVDIADILAARTDLTKVMKTNSETVREKTKCAINKVLIGKVPFRGGKPSAIGPPPDMPQFSKREAPKDQRSGRGRGGQGDHGGHRDQGGHRDHGGYSAEQRDHGGQRDFSGQTDHGGAYRKRDRVQGSSAGGGSGGGMKGGRGSGWGNRDGQGNRGGQGGYHHYHDDRLFANMQGGLNQDNTYRS